MASPYKIQIDQSALDDLQDRLRHSRLPDHIMDNRWTDGTDSDFLQVPSRTLSVLSEMHVRSMQAHIQFKAQTTPLQELLQYWQTTYDWRKQEASLNQSLHHFRLSLNSIDLHFVHERSKHSDALPLLLVHGWPGSFLEFTELIPLLTNPGASPIRPLLTDKHDCAKLKHPNLLHRCLVSESSAQMTAYSEQCLL